MQPIDQPFFRHKRIIGLLLVTMFLTIDAVSGQSATQQRKNSKKTVVPEPERVLINSKDNVELRAEWFAGTRGKETVPVIMLHDWDGDRRALTPLAKELQNELGCAVIVPDMRGHGESLTIKGVDEELDRNRFKKMELASMVEDIDSCRRFLQEKNDRGELNLDSLIVIACGSMATHAVNWCISDWSWPPIGGVKQGENVKSLVLISPRRKMKSLSLTPGLKTPLFANKIAALPVLMFWGTGDGASSKDGTAIYDALKKSRSEPVQFDTADERWEKQTVFKLTYDSGQASEALLRSRFSDITQAILVYLENKIIANQEKFPWQSRVTE